VSLNKHFWGGGGGGGRGVERQMTCNASDVQHVKRKRRETNYGSCILAIIERHWTTYLTDTLSVTRTAAQFITRFVQGDNKQTRAALLSLDSESRLGNARHYYATFQHVPSWFTDWNSLSFMEKRKLITVLKRYRLVFHNISVTKVAIIITITIITVTKLRYDRVVTICGIHSQRVAFHASKITPTFKYANLHEPNGMTKLLTSCTKTN